MLQAGELREIIVIVFWGCSAVDLDGGEWGLEFGKKGGVGCPTGVAEANAGVDGGGLVAPAGVWEGGCKCSWGGGA